MQGDAPAHAFQIGTTEATECGFQLHHPTNIQSKSQRSDILQYNIGSLAAIGPPVKRHLNGVSLADQLWLLFIIYANWVSVLHSRERHF